MTTKLANPHYLPDVCIKVTLINFTVTLEGLEDQLLVEVVKCEQPELEETRNNLIIELSDFKRQLKNSEDKILKFVAEAGKEILENDTLVNDLNSSKVMSTTISERMEESERISYDIARDRENYRGVAIRGSVLYFVIADLANINFMYQYSLEFFLKLFVLRLKNSKKSDVMEERLAILIDDITNSVYTNICRGLFEQDKLMFSFMNTANILRRGSLISVDEWNFFLRGSVTDFRSIPNNVDYIDEVTWHGLLGL
jgi:dynein heavy chain